MLQIGERRLEDAVAAVAGACQASQPMEHRARPHVHASCGRSRAKARLARTQTFNTATPYAVGR